jgi:hypothetical protein
MTTKTITDAYSGGYYLKPAYTALDITSSASVGGAGVTAGATQPSSIDNQGSVSGTGVAIALGAGGKIVNGGTITGGKTLNAGGYAGYITAIQMTDGGTVINGSPSATSALIDGGGVTLSGGAGTVVNYGDLRSRLNVYGYHDVLFPAAIEMTDGGSITNGAGGDISATIGNGVTISGATGTVVNFGTIAPYPNNNYAVFYGTYGVYLAAAGHVTNGSAADSSAAIVARAGVRLVGAGTVTNFGLIESLARKHNAVAFNDASDVLVEEGTGMLIGDVSAVAGDTLILGAAAGAGTIGGIGGTITGFTKIEVAAGAGWHLTGGNTIVSGQTLTTASGISEDGRLTNSGVVSAGAIVELEDDSVLDNAAGGKLLLVNDAGVSPAAGATHTNFLNAGAIEEDSSGTSVIRVNVANTGVIEVVSGTFRAIGTVAGAGTVRISDGTADFASTFTEHVDFVADSTGVLELEESQAYTGTVSGFSTTGANALDLGDISYKAGETTANYSGTASVGVLTVTDGTHTAKIKLRGDYLGSTFALSSDGHGGTLVRDPAPASTHALVAAIASFARTAAGASISIPANHIAMPLLATPGRPY